MQNATEATIKQTTHTDQQVYIFRAQAWTAANDKARELGWIV
jgi:hypothetical protein